METTAVKPVGGFVFVSATGLLAAWWAYKRRFIQFRDFRVWLACHELLEQRQRSREKRIWRFDTSELRPMVGGVGGEHLRASVRRLERVGLLRWDVGSIWLPKTIADVPMDEAGELGEFLATVTNHRRRVPVPRRLLAMLVGESRPVFMATALGHLLRCMYYRREGCRGRGLCKSSWVARVFEVNHRNVKAARAELVRRGVLLRHAARQRVLDKHGAPLEFNFRWECTETKVPPRDALSTSEIPPPERTGISSFGRSENTNPGCTRTDGVRKRTEGKPRLARVLIGDLQDPKRTLGLLDDARSQGYVNRTEAAALTFFAAACHALRVGVRNAPGLFATVVRRGLWGHISQQDEDFGRQKLLAAQGAELVWGSETT